MDNRALLSIIKMKGGISKTELCREMDKRGDTRTRSAQYQQIAELCRREVEDRGEGIKTALYVRDA